MVVIGIFSAFLALVVAKEITKGNEVPRVTPDLLNQLLAEKRYEEFNYYLGINIPSLSQPRKDINLTDISGSNPMFHKDFLQGDMLISPKEEDRQGIRFDNHPGTRWPNNQGAPSYVPISVSNQFSDKDRNTIYDALGRLNHRMHCLKYVYYNGQNDYIHIFPGNGCWSYIGRRGGQQGLSLGNGCVWSAIVFHEMQHAIGFSHEHNRQDRDEYIEIQWDKLDDNKKSYYTKNDPKDFRDFGEYDFYTNMHAYCGSYNQDDYKIKKNGIACHRVGRAEEPTDLDINKIHLLYC